MSITGVLSIGNGEKCPFCDLINTKDIDILKHFITQHPKEMNRGIFGDADKESD